MFFTEVYYGAQKKEKMDGVFGTNGREEKFLEICLEKVKERDNFRNLELDRRMTAKCI